MTTGMDFCGDQEVPIEEPQSCSVWQRCPPSPVTQKCKDVDNKSPSSVRELVQKFSQSNTNQNSQSGNLHYQNRSFAGSFRPYMETDLDHVERELRRGVSFQEALGFQSESGSTAETFANIDEVAGNPDSEFGNAENSPALTDVVATMESSDAENLFHPPTPPEIYSNNLSGFVSKFTLRQKIRNILNFFQNAHFLVVDVDGTADRKFLRKSLADYYNLSYFVTSGQFSGAKNSGSLGKLSLTSASSSSTAEVPRGQESHAVSTSSSFNMNKQEISPRTLAFIEFMVKYTDFEIEKDWFERLRENPTGPEMEELGVYVSKHKLQKKLDKYHADHQKGDRSTSCSPVNFSLFLSKMKQKILHPRDYRHRKDLWRCLKDGYLAKNRGGFEIHACPALLDVTVDSSRKNSSGVFDLWNQKKWAEKFPAIQTLLADVQTYVQSLESDRTVDRRSVNYHNVVDMAELLITANLPVDFASAESFVEIVVHFAETLYEFWTGEEDARVPMQSETLPKSGAIVDGCAPQASENSAGTDAERSVQNVIEQAGFSKLSQEIDEELSLIRIEKTKAALRRNMSLIRIPEPMPVILESPIDETDPSLTADDRELSDQTLLQEIKEFEFQKKSETEEATSLLISSGGSFFRKNEAKTSDSPASPKFCNSTVRQDSVEGTTLDRLILALHEDIVTSSLMDGFVSVGPFVQAYEDSENKSPTTSAKNFTEYSVDEDCGYTRSEKFCRLSVAEEKMTLKDMSTQDMLDQGPCCRVGGELIYLSEETHADSVLPNTTNVMHVLALTELGTWV